MKGSIQKTFTVVTLLLAISGLFAQEEKNYDQLLNYIKNSRELFDVPGIAVGIIKDGEIVFNHGIGYVNNETMDTVTTESIFGIASCSKAFTAACLSILVDEGTIEWTDKVIDHYPKFKLADPYITKEMQVQDLLCHRSGLITFDGDLLWYGSDYSREEIVERIQFRDITYSLRSQFGYQNVMYVVAGELIKEVKGKTWDVFIKEKIFDPLEMNATSTSNSHFTDDMDLALPHVDAKPMEFLNYDNCGPAASMNTTSTDLLKWVDLLLNKGSLGETKVFSEDQYYKLTTPLTLLNAGKGEEIGGTHFYSYGLGWFMFDYKGRKIIQHGGGLPGFHSKVVLVPEDGLGFVIIANELSGLVETTYKKILDMFISGEEKDWAQIYFDNQESREKRKENKEKEKESSRKTGTKPSLKIKEYEGNYQDKMYGDAKIEYEGKSLKITLVPSVQLFTSKMEHWENDTWKIIFNDPFLPSGYVTFEMGESMNITGFTISIVNPVIII